jgi:hypothetical protein
MENAAEQMVAAELDLEDMAWDIAEIVDPTGIASVARFYIDVDKCTYPNRDPKLSSEDLAILNSVTAEGEESDPEQCRMGHDERPGATSRDRCTAMWGCCYHFDNDHCGWCDDHGPEECRMGHDSRPGLTSEDRCLSRGGCCYFSSNDGCYECDSLEAALGQNQNPDAATCAKCTNDFVNAGGCDVLSSGNMEGVSGISFDPSCIGCPAPCDKCGLGFDKSSQTGCSAAAETSVGITLDAFRTEKIFSANNYLLIPCLFFSGMGVGMWFMKKDTDSASGYLLATEEI